MEATESLVAALLEARGYIVTTDYKVRAGDLKTFGGQSHDIDLDIVAFDSRSRDVLVGEVKSWWGSRGFVPDHIAPSWNKQRGPHRTLKVLNDKDGIQQTLWKMLKRQIGDYNFRYTLFVGRIHDRSEVEKRLKRKRIFGNPVDLSIIEDLLRAFIQDLRGPGKKSRSYVNHPAVAAILALEEYEMLK